jgi:hypothetical protein
VVGVAGFEAAAVGADLVVDELEVLLQGGDPGGDLDAGGLREGEALLLVAGACGD